MGTKVSFIVPCRNKAGFVARTVNSVLAQTYSPMEIVLSDQGSTDGTYEIIKDLADKYTGPNTVRVLQCPHTEYKGMAGLNAHLNWLHEQITGDLVIMCSADDLNHPDRAQLTVEAFEKYNPSYVGTCVQYLNKDLEFHGEMTAYGLGSGQWDRPDGFIDPVENIKGLIGSSASSAWARDLYVKYGPLKEVESQDILLPFFATLERGIYYVNTPLHAYVKHADENNTGLEGVCRAAADKVVEVENKSAALAERIMALPKGLERQKLEQEHAELERQFVEAKLNEHAAVEVNNYHYAQNFFAIFRRVRAMGIQLIPELELVLLQKMIEGANAWVLARDKVTMVRAQPKAMKV